MSANTQRINRWLKAIEDQIAFWIPTAVITHAYDTSNDECLAIEFSGQTHRVRGKPEAAPASGQYDGLGLAQRVYAPDLLQIGIDTSAEGGGLDADTELMRAALYTVVTSKNCRCQIFAKSSIALTDMVDGDASLVFNFQPAYDGFGYTLNM